MECWARLLRQPVWLLATGFALLFVGFGINYLSVFASMVFGALVLRPMTYGQTYDGLPIVPGAVGIGLGIAVIAALDLARPAPTVINAPGAGPGRTLLSE